MPDNMKQTRELSSAGHGLGYTIGKSREEYEEELFMREVEQKLEHAEKQIENGEGIDVHDFLDELRSKYGL